MGEPPGSNPGHNWEQKNLFRAQRERERQREMVGCILWYYTFWKCIYLSALFMCIYIYHRSCRSYASDARFANISWQFMTYLPGNMTNQHRFRLKFNFFSGCQRFAEDLQLSFRLRRAAANGHLKTSSENPAVPARSQWNFLVNHGFDVYITHISYTVIHHMHMYIYI